MARVRRAARGPRVRRPGPAAPHPGAGGAAQPEGAGRGGGPRRPDRLDRARQLLRGVPRRPGDGIKWTSPGLVQMGAAVAGDGPALFDHMLVDDYQDTTLAPGGAAAGLAPDLVVAGDPDAHVFSFQGTQRRAARAVPTSTFPARPVIELAQAHRAPDGRDVEAWVTAHSSEEHAAVARELRRIHVEDGVAWGDLAVVVRRQGGTSAACCGRSTTRASRARCPSAGARSRSSRPPIPTCSALRWLVADPARRDELIEPLLTSDLVGLSPAAARGLMRLAQRGPAPRAAAAALDATDGLAPEEADAGRTGSRDPREARRGRRHVGAGRVQGPVGGAPLLGSGSVRGRPDPDLDTVVTFANVVAEARSRATAGVAGVPRGARAGEHGPGWSRARPRESDAVQVLTAHGAAGASSTPCSWPARPRATSRACRGPSRCSTSRRWTRAEPQSEQSASGSRTSAGCSGWWSGARGAASCSSPPTRIPTPTSSRRARGSSTSSALRGRRRPSGTDDEPGQRRARPPRRGAGSSPTSGAGAGVGSPRSRGLVALGVDPAALVVPARLDRHGTAAARDAPAVVLAAVEPRELRAAARAGRRARARRVGGLPRLGRQARAQHDRGRARRDASSKTGGDPGRGRRALAPAGVPVDGRVRGVPPAGRRADAQNWWFEYGEAASLANEVRFEFEFDGATIVGVHRPDRADARRRHAHHRLQDGQPRHAPKAEENLQLGIYYLAVSRRRRARRVPAGAGRSSSRSCKGDWKDGDQRGPSRLADPSDDEEEYQARVRERLSRADRA